MGYYGFQCYINDKFVGWLYTSSMYPGINWTLQNIEWCLKWKTEKGAIKNFDNYNARWQFYSGGGYLKIALLPNISPKIVKKDNLIKQTETLTFSLEWTDEIKEWLKSEREKLPERDTDIISRKFAQFVQLEIQKSKMAKKEDIEKIDVLDTDYADIVANSADVNFELQLVKFGMDLAEARTKTKFISLMKRKPQTAEEWEKLTQAWEEACGYKPTRLHLLLVEKLLWSNQEEAME